jgi:hypothetical protein
VHRLTGYSYRDLVGPELVSKADLGDSAADARKTLIERPFFRNGTFLGAA